jgi:hypothetical protein
MTTWWRRIPRAVQALLLAVAVVLLLLSIAYVNRERISNTLAHWTGEQTLVEQVKGTLALAYLRLTQPLPQTEPLVPMPHTGMSPYGVNTFLEQEVEPEKVDRSLQLIADAGFHWIRQQFPWEDIEIAGKGNYVDPKWNVSTWEKYDRIVDLAEKHGLEIIARLDTPPAWSRSMGNAEGWTLAPPDNYEDFGDFVYTVVSRYKGRIRYYQIWNEPNIFPEWGDQPADPAGYVELLKVAYRRAKEADPDCVIIAAALAPTTEETPFEFGPRNVSDLIYLEMMYEAGVQGHFDIMGAMAYGLWTGPYDLRTSRDRTNFSRVQLIREIMVRHGDADKPIWAAEVGWNAVPENFDGFPAYGRVSEQLQAVYAVEAYQRAAREFPWLGMMNYWFFRRPSDAEQNQAWYYFRMVEPDFTTLPAYDALSEMANQPPSVYFGYHQEDHWALNYSGPWEHVRDENAVLGGYSQGQDGATLEFTFVGPQLDLVLRDAAQAAHLQVTVDGRPARLSRPWAAPHSDAPAITVAQGLRDGPHRARIEVRGGPVQLDGVIVQRGRFAWLGWLRGLLTVGGVVLGTGRWRRAMSERHDEK